MKRALPERFVCLAEETRPPFDPLALATELVPTSSDVVSGRAVAPGGMEACRAALLCTPVEAGS
jgi:hypothetical protein